MSWRPEGKEWEDQFFKIFNANNKANIKANIKGRPYQPGDRIKSGADAMLEALVANGDQIPDDMQQLEVILGKNWDKHAIVVRGTIVILPPQNGEANN